MPYRSKAQAAYFHIHKKELESQGVSVDEWDRASKGMKLPYHAKKGGAVRSALNVARKYADGGGVNEWENLPRSPEGIPQITVTRPPIPSEGISDYAQKAANWFTTPSEPKPEKPPEPGSYSPPGQEVGTAVRSAGAGYLQKLKDMVDPFTKDKEGRYVADQPLPETPGKIPEVQQDPFTRGTEIAGEVASNLAGPPGAGAGWAALKAAGYGVNHAAIAFGLKAAQGAKNLPKVASAATKIAAEQGFLDTSKFTKVGHQLGYMPGGVYKDPTGVPYYLKFGTDIEQIKNENLASKLYQLAGTTAADVNVTHIGGKPGIASRMLPNSHQLSESKIPYNQIPGLHDNFVVDAWLANHDAVGTGSENPLGNIMIANGKAVRIDGGGALRYKGSGQIKNHFKDEADEIFSMRDPNFSHRSAQVFGDISDEALKAGAQKVADVDIEKLSGLIARYGPTDDTEKLALLGKLLKRRQHIMEHFGVQPKNAAQPVQLAPHELPPNSTNVPRTYEQIPFTEEDYQKFGESIPTAIPDDTSRAVKAIHPEELPPNLTRPEVDHKIDFLKNDTILSEYDIGKLLQDKKIGTADLQKIASKLVAGNYSHDHWKGAASLWKIAEHINPQTAEALFRNLPPSVQPAVGYAIKAMADELKHSPFETVAKDSGPLSGYNYYSTQTNKFEIPPGLKKDKAFLENVKKNAELVSDEYPPIGALQQTPSAQPHETASSALNAGPIKKSSLVIPPKELVYAIGAGKYAPGTAANKLVNAYGEDVSKIANAMYRLTSVKNTEYVDEIYKKLPWELQVGVNGDLSELYTKFGDPEAKAFKGGIPSPEGKKILNAFEEIRDWQGYIPTLGKFEKPIFPDEATKKLADNTGHNINVLFWKGNYKSVKYPEEIKDFSTKSKERANFLSHEKAIAGSGNYGMNKAPYVARAPKALRVDYSDLVQDGTYNSHDMHNIIEAARKEKADVLVIDNINDYGPYHGGSFDTLQTQYAFINQNVLRAPEAKFDPSMLHLAKPLLGIAGGGLFVYGTVAGQEKDKMNRGGIPALLHKAKKMARGGSDMSGGYHPRHPAGMIKSSIPGRTDKIPMSVPPGSYILPADIPSALGQGNTMAGEKILGTMFRSGPNSPGSTAQLSGKLPHSRVPKFLEMRRFHMGKFADGGSEEQTGNDDVPVIAAGGEWVLHPEQVKEVGHGDLAAGHRVLDRFVLSVRKKNIETLRGLKPPKK